MRLPLFGGKDQKLAKPLAQDQAERMLIESFRTLSALCGRLADFIETQRLSRQGYEQQGRYLERIDAPKPDEGGKKA